MSSELSGPEQWGSLHEGRLSAMIDVVRAAGNHTLQYFGNDRLTVDAKKDDSPVTIADKEAEQLTRKLLGERFPSDTLQGEEFAEKTGSSSYRWVVDPIDGTKSFICGVPLYSTLLALECDGDAIAGAIYIPALNEIVVAANGQGSWYRRCDDNWKRAKVSDKAEIDRAVFVTSEVATFATRDAADVYTRIEKATWLSRSWGDGYGYLMVATGRADIMIDPICNAWDVAAMLPILREAGGRFTDWKGTHTVRGGDGVGTNGHLHDAVLERLHS